MLKVDNIACSNYACKNINFNGGEKNLTKIAAENKSKTNEALKIISGIAGWVLLIGLLIGGWISSCSAIKHDKQNKNQEIKANTTANNNSLKTVDFNKVA